MPRHQRDMREQGCLHGAHKRMGEGSLPALGWAVAVSRIGFWKGRPAGLGLDEELRACRQERGTKDQLLGEGGGGAVEPHSEMGRLLHNAQWTMDGCMDGNDGWE
ncbi:hypothetical protein Purlil1_10694 [Purpureocillium lilacinum]|uniref:Uncharacterized protein n=1 Tax=Purpureocillium lilacinum TaxID=33203 RepID=A0ABR0BM03_PURLI|nr:hypothetical protein Purlil1_10694 [Purpureocillium lilacinum]